MQQIFDFFFPAPSLSTTASSQTTCGRCRRAPRRRTLPTSCGGCSCSSGAGAGVTVTVRDASFGVRVCWEYAILDDVETDARNFYNARNVGRWATGRWWKTSDGNVQSLETTVRSPTSPAPDRRASIASWPENTTCKYMARTRRIVYKFRREVTVHCTQSPI